MEIGTDKEGAQANRLQEVEEACEEVYEEGRGG